jgi:hypothetical protein
VKFDEQLAAYLYETRTLRLEGIGTFTLDSKASVPHAQEKEIYYPIEGLSFTYNPKTDTDEDLISFLVKKLHKIQPLIRSDLESYLSNIKQFINLGKPYTIEGVGTLSKNNQGTYEFTPGNFLPVKEELNPKRENEEHNYPVRSQSSAGKIFVIILIVVAALAALGGIGWGVSHLLTSRKTVTEEQQGVVDTLTQQPVETATGNVPSATVTKPSSSVSENAATISQPTSSDSVQYKMVFELTKSKARADKRTTQLHNYHSYTHYDSIRIHDSLWYRLFLPVKIRPADTVRMKDSLSIFFGHRIRVVKQ